MSKDLPAGAVPAADLGRQSRSWLYEAPIFYLLLMVVQRAAFPDDPAFRALNPNPLWLGILLFGLRYGMGAGLVSGALSGILYALGARQAGEAYLLEDADFYLMPGLFVVVGAAVGAVADRFAHRLSALNMKLTDADERIRGLQNQIQTQQKAMRAVEQQVVSQMSSVVTLYHGSRELGTLERAALPKAALDFFTAALQAEKASLYEPAGEGRWRLVEERGWAKDDRYPREAVSGVGVVGRAAAERRVVSVRDLFTAKEDASAAELEADAIMAAPLLDPDGLCAAVVAVQTMPFLRFNSAAVNLMALLAEWADESLAKCIQVEELKGRSVLDEELEVHSATYFEARAVQEFARGKRYALPLSLLLVEPTRAGVPADKIASFNVALGRVIRECLRETDVVARSPYEGSSFAVLLPVATLEAALDARARLVKAFRTVGLPGELRVGAGSYKASMSKVEELVEQAKADLG